MPKWVLELIMSLCIYHYYLFLSGTFPNAMLQLFLEIIVSVFLLRCRRTYFFLFFYMAKMMLTHGTAASRGIRTRGKQIALSKTLVVLFFLNFYTENDEWNLLITYNLKTSLNDVSNLTKVINHPYKRATISLDILNKNSHFVKCSLSVFSATVLVLWLFCILIQCGDIAENPGPSSSSISSSASNILNVFYAPEGTSGGILKPNRPSVRLSVRPSVRPSVTNRVSTTSYKLLKQI